MFAFAVCGVSASGKTTVVEHLVPLLRQRDFSVGTIKDIHAPTFAIDKPGTNTDRHRRAGSELSVAWGRAETDVLYPSRLPLDRVLSLFTQDIVILEGGTDTDLPRIVAGLALDDARERLTPNTFAFSGRIAASRGEIDGVPAINVLHDASRLADLVEQQARSVSA